MHLALEQRRMSTTKPWLPEKWDFEADIVVVGYGGAGSCAAIAAHDAGDKVLVLEKAPVGGGNAACCGGGMRIAADVPNAIKYYTALTQGTVEEESIRVLAESMHRLPGRLEAWGAELEWTTRHKVYYPSLPGAEKDPKTVFYARSASEKKRQELAGETIYNVRGDGLFAFIDGQVKKRLIEIMFETPAERLIQDPITKEILGVVARSAGGDQCAYIKGRKAVVLACGGFQNNREMLVNFLPNLTALPTVPFGSPYNTGDGVVMASEVGAKLWHMSGVELGMFAPRIPSEKFGVGISLERTLRAGSQAIFVNKSGKRFMNEAGQLSHRKDLYQFLEFHQETGDFPNIPLFMVFDDAYRRARPIVGGHMGWWWVHKVYRWSEDNSAEVDLGWITKANTIKELAEKINVDSAALRETVETYNNDCTKGRDSEFGRAKEYLAPLATGPFYATELCEPIINTQGGPKHNARSQVLDRNDRPIPRLYAAGELGSFFYPLYEGGSNLPEALAFGIIAAEDAAQLRRWDRNEGSRDLAG